MSLRVEPAPGLPDVLIVTPDVYADDRGLFLETYSERKYRDLGIPGPFVQDNHSRSRRGTIRGLHFQRPNPQGKLVYVARGTVWDVAVDIRPGSPTMGSGLGWSSPTPPRASFISRPGSPTGSASSARAQTSSTSARLYYSPADERTLLWSDPDLAIDWKVADPSSRPRIAPGFCSAISARGQVLKFEISDISGQ